MELAIGIDLGGTKIAAAVLDRHGDAHGELSAPTPTASAEEVVAQTIALAQGLLSSLSQREQVVAIGIGAPGTVDFSTGRVIFAPNLPLRDLELKNLLEREMGLPAFVDNDGNLAALGESTFGAGKSARNLIMLTLGTGIGGGIIVDKRLYRGIGGSAGEIGHMILNTPEAGRALDFEALASGSALVGFVRRKLNRGEASQVLDLVGDDPGKITGGAIADAARLGDPISRMAFEEIAHWLGMGLASIANIFNPELILLGGGMIGSADLFLESARKTMITTAISPNGEQAKIALAHLGNRAGLLGAGALAFSSVGG